MAKRSRNLGTVPIIVQIDWSPERTEALVDWIAKVIADERVRELSEAPAVEEGPKIVESDLTE